MTDSPLILRIDDDGVTILTLNRPQSRNSLSQGMLRALLLELQALAADHSVRVVVLAGAGPAFCAGHDLKEMRASGYDRVYTESLFADCAEVMQAISSSCKQRQDSIEQYRQGGRQDLVDKETAELHILQSYLPQPFTAEELGELVASFEVMSYSTIGLPWEGASESRTFLGITV